MGTFYATYLGHVPDILTVGFNREFEAQFCILKALAAAHKFWRIASTLNT